ncbi:MAG: hypothetical protein ACRYGO_12825 [Janthinobacterium lividum]
MFLVPCEPRCDEAMAFPSMRRSAVREVVALVSVGERHVPRHAFVVNVDGETLRIPYRLYYDPELLRQELNKSESAARHILLCLGTRHCDGYLRQECLQALLECEASWLTPYLLQLAGEYVVEIAEDVANAIGERSPATLQAFALENPSYLATLDRRVASYWNCHRHAYPDRNDYPGAKVMAALRAAAR